MPVGPDPGSAFPNYTVEVNDTAPIWVYSAQTVPVTHCVFGMVFSVNAFERNDIFQAAAISESTRQSLGSRSSGLRGGTVFSSIKRQLFKRQANTVVVVVVVVAALVVVAVIACVWYLCATYKPPQWKHFLENHPPPPTTSSQRAPHPLAPPSTFGIEHWSPLPLHRVYYQGNVDRTRR